MERTVSPWWIQLPGGRRIRVGLAPTAARRAELTALGRVSAANDRAAFQALGCQRRAIDALARSQEQLAAKLTELEERADLASIALVARLSRLDRRLESVRRSYERRLAAARSSARALVARERRELRSELQAQGAAARLEKIASVVQSLEGAAFGEPGRLLAENNVLLAGNQLFWSFVDPVLRALGLWTGSGSSPAALLSPVGSLLTAQALLGDRVRSRIVGGVGRG